MLNLNYSQWARKIRLRANSVLHSNQRRPKNAKKDYENIKIGQVFMSVPQQAFCEVPGQNKSKVILSPFVFPSVHPSTSVCCNRP